MKLKLGCSSSLLKEGAAALASSALLLNNGGSIGWSSPAVPSLLLEESWKTEFDSVAFSESWAGAIPCLTACLGNIITPFLVQMLGPKMSMLAISLPLFAIHWTGLVVCRLLPSLVLLLLSRALAGVSIGVAISIVPNYVIDIASVQNQGLLGLMPQLMVSVSLLISYVLGAIVDWWWLSLAWLLVQPILLILLLVMPDSPASLVQRGKTEEARAALVWLNRANVEERLMELQMSGSGSKEKGAGVCETLSKLSSSANYRPLLASVALLVALQLTGVSPLVFFSVKFFRLAGASTSPSLCSIIVATITLVTVVLVVLLAKNISRRLMMLISQVGVTLCLFAVSGYFLAESSGNADMIRWLPLLILVLYFIFFNLGLSSYVWVITAEILPSEIRNQIIPLAIFVSTLIWFLVTFFFQAMFDAMGGIYIFLFYALASLFFTITTFLFIPEMTGRSEEEIAEFYRNFKLCKQKTSKV